MWSITRKQKLYSVEHDDQIRHVHLLSDKTLDFDLITCGEDRKVKLWRQGQLVKTLDHSNKCWRFDLDNGNRLLAVATGNDSEGGVTLWRLSDYEKIGEEKIGDTRDVRFNDSATKVLATTYYGPVYQILLE